MMQKFARKSSSDSNQEHLRELKAQWNSLVSLLVHKLIAFKQGINGFGNEDAGLPAVNIKDAFPSVMYTYLGSIVEDYNRVTSLANQILSYQNNYSQTRRKKIQAILEESDLVSEASWFGSRLWSRIGLIGLKGKNERKIRIELIESAANAIEDLDTLEKLIYSKDSNGVFAATKELHKILGNFQNLIKPNIELIRTIYGLNKKIESEEEKPKSKRQKEEEVEAEVGSNIIREAPPEPFIIPELRKIKIPYLDVRIRKLKNEVLKDELTMHLSNLRSLMSTLPMAMKQVGYEVTVDDKKIIQEILDTHKFIQNQLGPDNKKINKKELDKATAEYENFQRNFEKFGHSAVSRWINRKLLGLSDKDENKIKLRSIESLLEIKDKLDKLLNLLESKSSKAADILSTYDSIVSLLEKVVDDLLIVIKRHILFDKDSKSKLKEGIFADITKMLKAIK
jgi:hypothetical protein